MPEEWRGKLRLPANGPRGWKVSSDYVPELQLHHRTICLPGTHREVDDWESSLLLDSNEKAAMAFDGILDALTSLRRLNV